jgi:hypothetical protein
LLIEINITQQQIDDWIDNKSEVYCPIRAAIEDSGVIPANMEIRVFAGTLEWCPIDWQTSDDLIIWEQSIEQANFVNSVDRLRDNGVLPGDTVPTSCTMKIDLPSILFVEGAD